MKEIKSQVAADIRAIFNAPDRHAAEALLKVTVMRYEKDAPKLVAWMEANIMEGLTAFVLPQAHQRLIRTSNSFTHL
jgi:transposase-like protein